LLERKWKMSHRLIVIIFLVGAAVFVLSGCAASDKVEKAEMVEETTMDIQVEEPVVEKAEEVEKAVAEKDLFFVLTVVPLHHTPIKQVTNGCPIRIWRMAESGVLRVA
jgi:hypothetical protein